MLGSIFWQKYAVQFKGGAVTGPGSPLLAVAGGAPPAPSSTPVEAAPAVARNSEEVPILPGPMSVPCARAGVVFLSTRSFSPFVTGRFA